MKRHILDTLGRNLIPYPQIKVKRSSRKVAAFSLVEVTLALGVAAFALLAIVGMLPTTLKTQQTSIQQTTANSIISQIIDALRADVRLPPGQESKICGDDGTCAWGELHGNWLRRVLPDTLYFTNEGKQTGAHVNESPPADAAFRATITYMAPPTVTTAIAKITVSWPAAQGDLTKVAGSIDMFAAVNR